MSVRTGHWRDAMLSTSWMKMMENTIRVRKARERTLLEPCRVGGYSYSVAKVDPRVFQVLTTTIWSKTFRYFDKGDHCGLHESEM